MSIFYDMCNRTYEEQLEIFKYAKSNCYLWQHDILDCEKSFSRQNVVTSNIRTPENSFDEVIKKFHVGCHSVFIDRQGRGTWNKPDCWEIGFSTMSPGPDHYLFIHVDPTIAYELIERFNMKAMR